MSPKDGDPNTRVEDLAASLRRRIVSGNLASGDHMPSVRGLARTNGVSSFTAARVYDLLVAEGLVDARRGAGYFVAPRTAQPANRITAGPEPLSDSIWALRRSFDSRMVKLDTGCGWLPSQWLFSEGVRTALTHIARKPSAYAGRYGSVYGLRTLRRQITILLGQNSIESSTEQVVLTHGASQALELCINVLTVPGDCVMVDDPCYPYLLAMLRQRGVRPVGVPRTESGPDINALNALATSTRPRLFITNTNCQNPTGTSTSMQVAHEVLLTARTHDFTIVEDDIFSELAQQHSANLASLDRLRQVVYIGSFSKTIAPNLRVGFVVASEERAQKIASLKNVLSLSSSELTEQIVHSILTSGRHRAHLSKLRQRLADAQEAVAHRLEPLGVDFAYRSSGMFIWAKLPTKLPSSTVMQLAKSQGILLAPGEVFRPDGRSTGHYRFNVAYSDSDLLSDFIKSLPA